MKNLTRIAEFWGFGGKNGIQLDFGRLYGRYYDLGGVAVSVFSDTPLPPQSPCERGGGGKSSGGLMNPLRNSYLFKPLTIYLTYVNITYIKFITVHFVILIYSILGSV